MSIAEKLTQVAENAQKVYDAGYAAGQASGNDGFWDAYQNEGNRTDCSYMFAGQGWNDETFKPKYDIKPTTATNLFTATCITDLVARLEECGVRLDLSECADGSYLASTSSSITTFPTADLRKRTRANATSYLFYNCANLRVIEEVILANGTQEFANYSFGSLPALEEIRFRGWIGRNGLNFSASTKLSNESFCSIIEALADKTYTWTKTNNVVDVSNGRVEEMSVMGSFTTTGEEVLYYQWYDENDDIRNARVCEVDGVYYEVTEVKNTTPYTITIGTANLARFEDDGYEPEIAYATEMGWTIV